LDHLGAHDFYLKSFSLQYYVRNGKFCNQENIVFCQKRGISLVWQDVNYRRSHDEGAHRKSSCVAEEERRMTPVYKLLISNFEVGKSS